MVVDCFMFFNELDLLELRLQELYSVVDKFVILECGETLAGIKKPFIFEQNCVRFAKYSEKIDYIKLVGLPPLVQDTEDRRFYLERFQRNQLILGLIGRGLALNDLILISDVDEIPSRAAVEMVSADTSAETIWVFRQKYFKFFLDHDVSELVEGRDWLGTVAARFNTLGEYLPHELRIDAVQSGRFFKSDVGENSKRKFVDNGGWHLTYFGGENAHNYKLIHFAHGANKKYGAPNSLPMATISKEELKDLRPFDDALENSIRDYIRNVLKHNAPSSISSDLHRYYHLFLRSFNTSPLPWLKIL